MNINEWILELTHIFNKETEIILEEYDNSNLYGFSKDAYFVMEQITYFAEGLSKGYLTLEEVKNLGVKSLKINN